MSSDEEDFFSSFRKKEEERVAILIAETENKLYEKQPETGALADFSGYNPRFGSDTIDYSQWTEAFPHLIVKGTGSAPCSRIAKETALEECDDQEIRSRLVDFLALEMFKQITKSDNGLIQ